MQVLDKSIRPSVRHMPDGSRVPVYIRFGAGMRNEDEELSVRSPIDEELYCTQMKRRRLSRKVVKRWLYFMRSKKMDRVPALYLRRLIWNPQIRSHIAGFAAQTP